MQHLTKEFRVFVHMQLMNNIGTYLGFNATLVIHKYINVIALVKYNLYLREKYRSYTITA
jgi:hypothetical protein